MQIQFLKSHRIRQTVLVVGFCLAFVSTSFADNNVWQFGVGFGQHHADLNAFNDGVLRANIVGYGDVLGNGTNDVTERRSFRFDMPINVDTSTPRTSVQLNWQPNHRHHVVFGFGYWEARGEVSTSGELPTQGKIHSVLLTRRAKLSYSDFYVGWLFNAFRYSNFSLYTSVVVDEIFDIDYNEEFVVIYTSGSELAGSSRNRAASAQGAAAIGLRSGLGIELNLRDVVFIAIEGGYYKGYNQVQLKAPTVKSDFQPRDFLEFGMPYGTTPDGKFGYQAIEPQPNVLGDRQNNSRYFNMPLSFDGWTAMARIGIKF